MGETKTSNLASTLYRMPVDYIIKHKEWVSVKHNYVRESVIWKRQLSKGHENNGGL